MTMRAITLNDCWSILLGGLSLCPNSRHQLQVPSLLPVARGSVLLENIVALRTQKERGEATAQEKSEVIPEIRV